MAWNVVAQSSIPKSKTANGSSSSSQKSFANGTTKPTSTISQSLASTIPLDNTLKPLGVLLLRIMYDEQYLTKVIAQNKSDLITPHGLINSGSICYMNSIMQLLFVCEPFTQMLNIIRNGTLGSLDSSNSKTPIIDASLSLLESFKKVSDKPGKTDIINPMSFYNSIAQLPRFRHLKLGVQEDAEEFLGHLLDGIHEECVDSIAALSNTELQKLMNLITDKDTKKKVTLGVDLIKNKETANGGDDDGWHEVGSNRKIAVKRTFEVKPSPIVKLFGGQFRSVLQTPTSKKSSITLDPFMHVQLDISDPDTVDLVSAFDKLAEVEEISFGESNAKKQNFIDKLPQILIIHLKRFSFVTEQETAEEEDTYEVVSSNSQTNQI
ncbi:unnamed protein product [Ambrosiozyma monospora]|uniref:Unnamed protein product n=1 Tax=Ambrosiozyma monospora TaxID=43982 RepID=A0ACB5TCR9_AMBMO|nr:unnamed protein product [Ambrosiozyma monospora]